jgi:hypothetical protein
MEHRWGERLTVTLPVRIRAAYGLVGAGMVTNFSVSGAFIVTTLPVALLTRVRVSFASAHRSRRRMRAPRPTFAGLVVRSDAAGFAVEWSEFGVAEILAFANSNRPTRDAAARESSLAGHAAKA